MLRDSVVILPFSMCNLFHWDSLLCSVSSSSRTPTLRVSSTGGAPRVDRAQGRTVGHGPQDSPGDLARSGGALTLGTTIVADTVASEVVPGDRCPALAPNTTVVADGTTATLIGPSVSALSPQPHMGASTALVATCDDQMEEPNVILGTPFLGPQGTSPLTRQ
jgi:hypothetical protein